VAGNRKNKSSIKSKLYRKLHWLIFSKIRPGKWIYNFYASYRHRNKKAQDDTNLSTLYITQMVNDGAGIGHQIANYNGGYHTAQILGINHAYSGFSDMEWDEFLGFGVGEQSVLMLKKEGYKVRKLPYFNESRESLELIKKIVNSYAGEKIVFCIELDQFYQKQYEVIPHIKEKFESAPARQYDRLIYDKSKINMAVHIRRGDIVDGQKSGKVSMTKRWLTTDYYLMIVKQVAKVVGDQLEIYLFSQGNPEEFKEFEEYGHINYCFDMSARDSFLHMVRADILVTSKSSFSYKPALLADGLRICPAEFWHGYPRNKKWILAGDKGEINQEIELDGWNEKKAITQQN